MTALILCDSRAQAVAASEAVYRLGVPAQVRASGDYRTMRALALRQHPTSGDWALVVPDGSLGFAMHPALVQDSSLIEWPSSLNPFVDDGATALQAARDLADQHEANGTQAWITGAWLIQQVTASRVLEPGDPGYDGWFPPPENP